MIKIEQNGIMWIDIVNPTREKIGQLTKLFKLHPIVKQELLLPAFRAKVDSYGDLLYLVLHFPVYDEKTKIAQPQEVDFVITKKFLVTAHYQEIPALRELALELQNNQALQKKLMRLNTVKLIYQIILRLFQFALRELDHIEEKISRIESDIFADRQKEMVRLISLLRSDIINFSRAMNPLAPLFKEFRNQAIAFFGKQWSLYFTNMTSEYAKIMNIVQTRSQTIESLQATNDSLLSFHINHFLKILAIINLLVLPLVVIESVIGMRWYIQEIRGSLAMVEVGLAVFIALLFDILLLALFRYKKWL